jgi:hypothetical protein
MGWSWLIYCDRSGHAPRYHWFSEMVHRPVSWPLSLDHSQVCDVFCRWQSLQRLHLEVSIGQSWSSW